MTPFNLFNPKPGTRAGISARDYQIADHDESFRLWNSGERGVLTRSATGSGKTIMACLKMDTWLQRGERQRCMVVSYERQLVWQFSQEIEDVLGIHPGIEMENERIDADNIPKIVVACRASLVRWTPPTSEILDEMAAFGITNIGAAAKKHCEKALKMLKGGADPESVRQGFFDLNNEPEAAGGYWSRLHKFDWRFNWLVIFDEAHRHAYKLNSVGHIVDWFDQNPESKRNGITATPKRGDEVSLGHKMFPSVALDYPLFSPSKACAVKDGYAVPYMQRYIEVEGVDFKSIKRIQGDFDDAELEKALGEERTLAKLVVPLLDMVGDRRTLIFSPGVEMAKNVARFINARVETRCACGVVKWYPRPLIGDGATCECGAVLDAGNITKNGEQARELDGESPEQERRQVYRDHQAGRFQFLSVCGLCREGYNDPDVSCVAVFRPVTKKASSLAEQMKGRGCRPLSGLLNGLTTREERLEAIANSSKPNALIVDLVGITGLADCATTVQIYADGLPDEVAERAEKLIEEDEELTVEEAVERAKQEDDELREKVRQEREDAERKAKEAAERRAKAGAEVTYTTHESGTGSNADPLAASEGQYKFCAFLGMQINVLRSKKQIGRVINQLKQRMSFEEIARTNRLGEGDWEPVRPSLNQIGFMRKNGIPTDGAATKRDASLLIDAKLDPQKFAGNFRADMGKVKTGDELTATAKDLSLVRGVLPAHLWEQLASEGRDRRANLEPASDSDW